MIRFREWAAGRLGNLALGVASSLVVLLLAELFVRVAVPPVSRANFTSVPAAIRERSPIPGVPYRHKPNGTGIQDFGSNPDGYFDGRGTLTYHINSGAMQGGQRPYSLVLVTDEPVPPNTFSQYQRLCRVTMNTFPAERQFAPDRIGELVAYVKSSLKAYTEQHLRLRGVKGA